VAHQSNEFSCDRLLGGAETRHPVWVCRRRGVWVGEGSRASQPAPEAAQASHGEQQAGAARRWAAGALRHKACMKWL